MPVAQHIADELAACVSAETVIRRDEPMARHTTLRVGGPADVYVEPATTADLANIVKYCSEARVPFFVIGRGSNLLVRDRGVRGVVVCLVQPDLSRIEITGEQIRCGRSAERRVGPACRSRWSPYH